MPGPKKNKRKPNKPQRTRKTNVSHQHLARKYDGLVGRYNGLAEKLTSTNRYLISLHAEMTTLREVLLETLADEEIDASTVRDTVEVLDRILDPLDISMGETPRERELSSPAEPDAPEVTGLDGGEVTGLDGGEVTGLEGLEDANHPTPRKDSGVRYGGEKVSNPDQRYG